MDGASEDGARPVRLLVVAAEELFRRGLSALLAADPEVKIVGVTRDPVAARGLAAHLGADVVLADLDGRAAGIRSEQLACLLGRVASHDHRQAGGGVQALTRRQLEVLCLVAKGLNNKDVAEALFLAENTVKNHVRNIFAKLGVRTRIQAAILAVRDGLVDPDELLAPTSAPGDAGDPPVH